MYDVIVIGGGSGGYAAAIRSAQLGGQVALVEGSQIGGTCVNRGCIPSKIWLRGADLLRRIKVGEEFGIRAPVEAIDFNAVVERKNGVSAEIRMGMEALLQNNGVEVVNGRATLKSPTAVEIDGRIIETKKVIIATGSSLCLPEVSGLDEAAMTTDDVLEMTAVPESMLVCGAGYIEVEMAYLLNTFGCKVIIAAGSARILPMEDSETSQRLAQALRERGVEIATRVTLASVETTESGSTCKLAGAKEREVKVEKVLVSAREPNTSDLGLENIGVAVNDDKSIQVNHRLETSVEGIYAIGDATGGTMLSHAASSAIVYDSVPPPAL